MGNNNTNGRKSQTVIIEKEVVQPETGNAATTEAPIEASQEIKETPNKPKKPIKLILAGLGVGAIAAGAFGYNYWQYASTHQQTDNATVTGNIHQVSSRIPGTIAQVLVSDNQLVQPGQLLVKLDPRDYQVKVQQAQASLENAQRQAQAAQANIALSSQTSTGRTAQAQGDVSSATAAIAQAQAALNDAQLQLSYTNITAPTAGRVGKKTAEVGNRVQAGTRLMAIVDDNYWLVANFKETQLENMQPGQPVKIKLDAFPHKTFTGRVDSISPASGGQFALLPPDNATGNFTKVVQRIPVKIIFDQKSIQGYAPRITPGMSAEVSVDVK